MGILSSEFNNLNNSVLTAYLIYRFTSEYIKNSDHRGMPIPLAYIPVPLLIDENYYEILCGTYKSWYKFLSKFPQNNLTTASITNSIESNFPMSQNGICMGLKINILSIEPKLGKLIPLSSRMIVKSKLNVDIENLCHQAEKLANWCKDYSVREVFSLLNVEL